MQNDIITNKTVFTKNENIKLEKKIKIDVKSLSAFFGKAKVLKEINLSVPENKVLAIIGPSGCGKSTFLRCINRMHEIVRGTTTGKILFDGKDIYKYDPVILRRKIGMVFQKPNPFPTMSIFHNVIVGLKLNGYHNKKKLAEIAEKTLRQADRKSVV